MQWDYRKVKSVLRVVCVDTCNLLQRATCNSSIVDNCQTVEPEVVVDGVGCTNGLPDHLTLETDKRDAVVVGVSMPLFFCNQSSLYVHMS